MPEIHLTCHACGATLRLGDPARTGKNIKCPKCGAICEVPSAAGPAEEAFAEAARAPVAAAPAPRKWPRPEGDGEQDAPRPREGAGKEGSRSTRWLLIGIGGSAAILLVAVGVLWGIGVFDGMDQGPITKGPGPINPGPGDGENPGGAWPLKPLTPVELAQRRMKRETNYLARRAEESKWVEELQKAAGPGQPLLVWERPKGSGLLHGLTFSPDGSLLVAQHSKTIDLWDVKTRKQLWSQKASFLSGPDGLRFSRDSKFLASSGMLTNINVHDARTGEVRATLGGPSGGVGAVAFTPDGKSLISAGTAAVRDDIEVTLWDLEKPGRHLKFPAGLGKAKQLTLSDDGRLLLFIGFDDVLQVHDLHARVKLWSAPIQNLIYDCAFAPDGVHFGYHNPWKKGDRSLYVVNPDAGKTVCMIRTPESARYPGWAFTPSGKTLLFWHDVGEGSLWEMAGQGKKLQDIKHDGLVPPVAFSPGGEMVATVAGADVILVWAAADLLAKAPAQP